MRKIRTDDINGRQVFLDYSNFHEKFRHLCKAKCSQILFSGDSLNYELPQELQEESYIAIAPVRESHQTWIKPSILEVDEGRVRFVNETLTPIVINKDMIFADAVKTRVFNADGKAVINKIIEKTEDTSRFIRPEILNRKTNFLRYETPKNLDICLSKDRQLTCYIVSMKFGQI